MKPFDIDRARDGHPVCYRDGTQPDWVAIPPPEIVASAREECIMTMTNGRYFLHHANGRYYGEDNGYEDDALDLFLAPQKRVGWIVLLATIRTEELATRYEVVDVFTTEAAAQEHCAFVSGHAVARVEWEE